MHDPAAPATTDSAQLAALCHLADDNRRRLYDLVVAADEPLSRDEASAALDLDRSLVAYHLDKLVEAGLLADSFARPHGRGGPGAGRPAKHYERAEREFAVSVPPRGYLLAAELLARAAEDDPTGAVRSALERAAEELGRELAGDGDPGTDDLAGHLSRLGFEPYEDDGVTRLRNCPFRRLAREHTELVCGMNLALLGGLAAALGVGARPRLDPAPGRCCVAFDAGR